MLFRCLVGEDKNLVVGGVYWRGIFVGGGGGGRSSKFSAGGRTTAHPPPPPSRENPAIRYSGYINVKYVEYGIRLWNVMCAIAHAHLHTPLICFRLAKKAHINI